jgi:hypothetical protein
MHCVPRPAAGQKVIPSTALRHSDRWTAGLARAVMIGTVGTTSDLPQKESCEIQFQAFARRPAAVSKASRASKSIYPKKACRRSLESTPKRSSEGYHSAVTTQSKIY